MHSFYLVDVLNLVNVLNVGNYFYGDALQENNPTLLHLLILTLWNVVEFFLKVV